MRFAFAVAPFLLLAACAGSDSSDRPRIPASDVDGGPHRGDETLILYVVNESGETPTLDFEIAIDGKVVARDAIDRDNNVEPQPRKEIRLALAPGEHALDASTQKGNAKLSQHFTITGKHWAVLVYWYYTGTAHSKPMPRSLDFRIYDKQPRFL